MSSGAPARQKPNASCGKLPQLQDPRIAPFYHLHDARPFARSSTAEEGWQDRTADVVPFYAYNGLKDPHLASFCAKRRDFFINSGLVTKKGTLTRNNVALGKMMIAERILANVERYKEQCEDERRLEERVAAARRCEFKGLLELQASRLRSRLAQKMSSDRKRAATVSPSRGGMQHAER